MINKTNTNITKFDQDELNQLFMDCCKGGDLETIKYMFTSPKLKFRPDLDYAEDYYDGLTQAGANGQLNVVEYLLFSKELDNNASYGFYFDYLALICEGEHFHIADFLLEKRIFDPLTAFTETHNYVREPTLLSQYLIINCDVPLTPKVQQMISDKPLIAEMFAKRELNRELKEILDISNDKNKKFKL
jgi:hypothetical protein